MKKVGDFEIIEYEAKDAEADADADAVEYISKYVREQARQAGRLISFSYCWGKVISKKIQSSKSKTRSVMTDFQDSLAPTLVNICFSFLISKSN